MESEQFFSMLKVAHGAVSRFGFIDIGLIVLVLFGLLRGYRKGLGVVFGNVIQIAFMIVMTLEFLDPLAGLIVVQSDIMRFLLRLSCFIVLVVASYFVSKIVLQGAAKILTIQFNDAVDNLLGAFAGAAHLVLILSLLTQCLLIFPGGWVKETLEKQNLSGPFLMLLSVDLHQNTRRLVAKIVGMTKNEPAEKSAKSKP